MSTVKTDAIETAAGGTSVLTLGTATQTLKILGGTPGASKVLTSDATGGATWAAAGAGGKILQVVTPTVKTDVTSWTSNTMVDITGMTIDITPSLSSSRILIQWLLSIGFPNGSGATIRLRRDTTDIFIGDAVSNHPRATTYIDGGGMQEDVWPVAGMYIDSPATASAITYSFQAMDSNSYTTYLNRSVTDRDFALYDGRAASTIIAMEIGV